MGSLLFSSHCLFGIYDDRQRTQEWRMVAYILLPSSSSPSSKCLLLLVCLGRTAFLWLRECLCLSLLICPLPLTFWSHYNVSLSCCHLFTMSSSWNTLFRCLFVESCLLSAHSHPHYISWNSMNMPVWHLGWVKVCFSWLISCLQ